jgi:hypothetical protein
VNLEIFFISFEWEVNLPLYTACSPTRVGSDNASIILDSREHEAPRPKFFYFGKQWLLQPNFLDLVKKKWEESVARRLKNSYSHDNWHGSLCFLRQFLKG